MVDSLEGDSSRIWEIIVFTAESFFFFDSSLFGLCHLKNREYMLQPLQRMLQLLPSVSHFPSLWFVQQWCHRFQSTGIWKIVLLLFRYTCPSLLKICCCLICLWCLVPFVMRYMSNSCMWNRSVRDMICFSHL